MTWLLVDIDEVASERPRGAHRARLSRHPALRVLMSGLLLLGLIGSPSFADNEQGELEDPVEESDEGEEADPEDDIPADNDPPNDDPPQDEEPVGLFGGDDVEPFGDDEPLAPMGGGSFSLVELTVTPGSDADEPLGPGAIVTYRINYSCPDIGEGDCDDAVIELAVPNVLDIDGAPIPLGYEGATVPTVLHWNVIGLVGGSVRLKANQLAAGQSGFVEVQLRIPVGVIPALDDPQEFSSTATGTLDSSVSVRTSASSFVNAAGTASGITKTGPATVLFAGGISDPVTYTIEVCPQTNRFALWPDYEVVDTLPTGTTVTTDPLPLGGSFTEPVDAAIDGGTIVWNIDAGNRPPPNVDGCLSWQYTVRFNAPNVVGAVKTNSVIATGTLESVPTGIGPDTHQVTLEGPATSISVTKEARDAANVRSTFYVRDGETIRYRLSASNTSDRGAASLTTATLTDGPLPDEFTLHEIRTGSWSGAVDAVTATIQVSTATGLTAPTTESAWTTVSSSPNDTVASSSFPTEVRWVRWIFTSTDDPAIGPDWNASQMFLIGTVNGDPGSGPDGGITVRNCANLTGDQLGSVINATERCVNLELEEPQPHPDLRKTASSNTLAPGDTITYTLALRNDLDATGTLTQLTVTDCVPDAAHLIVSNVATSTGWTGVITGNPCTPAVNPPLAGHGTTGTELTFTFNGTLAPGAGPVNVSYDVTATGFATPTASSNPAPPGVRRNVAVIDTSGDGINHCRSTCSPARNITVPFQADLGSRKLVKGSLDSVFNRAGTTTPGGQVTWRIEVQNRGNSDVNAVQIIDTFPHLDDTGVRRLDQTRGSEYAPLLVSPIGAVGWDVEYSESQNPCRDEVLDPSDIPHMACEEPNWVATPDLLNLPAYRSIRLTYTANGGVLERGQTASFEWNMIAPITDDSYASASSPTGRLLDCTIPVSSPTFPTNPGASTLDRAQDENPSCPVARNSFAYGVGIPQAVFTAAGFSGTPPRLGSEPPQVALHVASDATGNVIGDRVWEDANNDGIQDPGEPGIENVRVDLLDASNPGSLVLLDTTFTDAAGTYRFNELPNGDYVVRFFLPDDRGFVSPRWTDTERGGGTNPQDQGDLGSGGNSDLDSDVPQEPSGTATVPTTGGGTRDANFYDTPVVTLGNPEDVDGDGREVDLTWDAGIWIPRPAIEIDKVTKDAAWNDAEARDGVGLFRDRPVEWIYTVTNTGNTFLRDVVVTDTVTTSDDPVLPPALIDCAWSASSMGTSVDTVLAPGESVVCRATGTAETATYVNLATVTGTTARFPTAPPPTTVDDYAPIVGKTGVPPHVTDDDPSDYTLIEPTVALDKSTSGLLFSTATGQTTPAGPGDGIAITPGFGVRWTYVVTNTGPTTLGDIVLVDDNGTPGDPDDTITIAVTDGAITVDPPAAGTVALAGGVPTPAVLPPGGSWTIHLDAIAGTDDYANDADVTAWAFFADGSDRLVGDDVRGRATDTSDSSYTVSGGPPSINLEKLTNGVDADDADDAVRVGGGEDVVWTFEITNDGAIPLLDVEVLDPQLSTTSICTVPLLIPAATASCETTGQRLGTGLQRNDATVSGQPAQLVDPSPVDPADPSTWPATPSSYTAITTTPPVTDEDPSHHFGTVPASPGQPPDPRIRLEKSTNGVDADLPDDAPEVALDGTVTWGFEVTNLGDVALVDVVVTDPLLGGVVCTIPVLPPIATVTCPVVTGEPFGEGLQRNDAEVVGTPARPRTPPSNPEDPSTWSDDRADYTPIGGADPVRDEDPSHHIGVDDGTLGDDEGDEDDEATEGDDVGDTDRDDPDGTGGGATEPPVTRPTPSGAELAIAKRAMDALRGGEELRWELTVRNLGDRPEPAGFMVIDQLPDGIRYLSASAGWSCQVGNAGSRVVCTSQTPLAAGASTSLVITTRADPGLREAENLATVLGSGDELDPWGDEVLRAGASSPVAAADAATEVRGRGRLAMTGASVLLLSALGVAVVLLGGGMVNGAHRARPLRRRVRHAAAGRGRRPRT